MTEGTYKLWLIDADPSNFILTVKGIRAARKSLELDSELERCKSLFDQFRADGPCVIASHEDAERITEAGRILAKASNDFAKPAIDPDPADVEKIRRGGVVQGLFQPRPGEEGLGSSDGEPGEPSDEQVFERRLYDTSLLLMMFADGQPVKAFLYAKQLNQVTRDEFFDLVADAMKVTFGIAIEGIEDA